MIDLKTFFLVRAGYMYDGQNCKTGMHALSSIGDFFLTPQRYFFDGRYAEIYETSSSPFSKKKIEVFNHQSYCRASDKSKEGRGFQTSTKSWEKTIFMIAAFVPGIFLGTAFKGFSYFSSKTRECHAEVKKYYKTHSW